jgi:hypothetical protein
MLVVILLLTGCASKEDEFEALKKDLLAEKPIAIYSVPSTGIYLSDRWKERSVLKKFPFIGSLTPFDFQGKFHTDFYDGMKVSWSAVSLDKVDWSDLSKNPSLVDIITIESVGIAQSGSMTDDFMNNIGKAYNISPANIAILKQWIEKGGVLWSESGISASRFETFYPYGGINDSKTMTLFSKDHGSIFGVPVRYRILKSVSVDMVNYTPEAVTLKAAPSAPQLLGVSKVIFSPMSFIESYPIIQSNPLLVDSKGTTYAGYEKLGKGMIVTMVPTIYWHADDDGELYRWKLLSWVLQSRGNEVAKFLENPKLKQ